MTKLICIGFNEKGTALWECAKCRTAYEMGDHSNSFIRERREAGPCLNCGGDVYGRKGIRAA